MTAETGEWAAANSGAMPSPAFRWANEMEPHVSRMNATRSLRRDASEMRIPPRELLATIFRGRRATAAVGWASNRPYRTPRFLGVHPGSWTRSGRSGRGGIRTLERLSALPVFKTGAIDHSATLPNPGKCPLSHRIGTPSPPPDTACSARVRLMGTHRLIAGFTAAACTTNKMWLSVNAKHVPPV
jgi:hypothetical protein